MSVVIPADLPAFEMLKSECADVLPVGSAQAQHRVLIVNLMPTKQVTETQLLRLISKSPLCFAVDFLRMSTHKNKTTPPEYLDRFYKEFEQIKDNKYAAVIITGAPVEKLDFEQVDYWQELCSVMDWAEQNAGSALYICWGAQAGLYYHHGINKYELGQKISGVYPHSVCNAPNPLMAGIPKQFYAPHSRYTAIDETVLASCKELFVLAKNERCGSVFIANKDCSQVYITGHIEYDPDTLAREYTRDVLKGISPKVPENYFKNDDPTQLPCVSWHEYAAAFYINWLGVACTRLQAE